MQPSLLCRDQVLADIFYKIDFLFFSLLSELKKKICSDFGTVSV